ncbi:hypothetical protein ACMGDH_06170 [Sphingomonas sp. DT-207]
MDFSRCFVPEMFLSRNEVLSNPEVAFNTYLHAQFLRHPGLVPGSTAPRIMASGQFLTLKPMPGLSAGAVPVSFAGEWAPAQGRGDEQGL